VLARDVSSLVTGSLTIEAAGFGRLLTSGDAVDFDLPQDLVDYLAELDDFIEREIKPLQAQDDNERFFDHRREDARTDWDRGGLPNEDWESLLAEMRRRSTSPARGSGCTTTCRTSRRSSATTSACC
jgi:hypothetical protein